MVKKDKLLTFVNKGDNSIPHQNYLNSKASKSKLWRRVIFVQKAKKRKVICKKLSSAFENLKKVSKHNHDCNQTSCNSLLKTWLSIKVIKDGIDRCGPLTLSSSVSFPKSSTIDMHQLIHFVKIRFKDTGSLSVCMQKLRDEGHLEERNDSETGELAGELSVYEDIRSRYIEQEDADVFSSFSKLESMNQYLERISHILPDRMASNKKNSSPCEGNIHDAFPWSRYELEQNTACQYDIPYWD